MRLDPHSHYEANALTKISDLFLFGMIVPLATLVFSFFFALLLSAFFGWFENNETIDPLHANVMITIAVTVTIMFFSSKKIYSRLCFKCSLGRTDLVIYKMFSKSFIDYAEIASIQMKNKVTLKIKSDHSQHNIILGKRAHEAFLKIRERCQHLEQSDLSHEPDRNNVVEDKTGKEEMFKNNKKLSILIFVLVGLSAAFLLYLFIKGGVGIVWGALKVLLFTLVPICFFFNRLTNDDNYFKFNTRDFFLRFRNRISQGVIVVALILGSFLYFWIDDPGSHNLNKFLLTAGVGFFIALLFMSWRTVTSWSVETVRDVEEVAGSTVIGLIPKTIGIEDSWKKNNSEYDHFDRLVKKIAALRSEENQIVRIVSSVPQEGKSMVVLNVASSFAKKGEKTLLIDADLKIPVIAERVGVQAENPIASVLKDKNPLTEEQFQSLVIPSQIDNLSLIASNDQLLGNNSNELEKWEAFMPLRQWSIEMNQSFLNKTKRFKKLKAYKKKIEKNDRDISFAVDAAVLLQTDAMKSIIDLAKNKYDRIIIDTPPIFNALDALIGIEDDVVIVVVGSERVEEEQLEYAKYAISQAGGSIHGAVLNLCPQWMVNHYQSQKDPI